MKVTRFSLWCLSLGAIMWCVTIWYVRQSVILHGIVSDYVKRQQGAPEAAPVTFARDDNVKTVQRTKSQANDGAQNYIALKTPLPKTLEVAQAQKKLRLKLSVVYHELGLTASQIEKLEAALGKDPDTIFALTSSPLVGAPPEVEQRYYDQLYTKAESVVREIAGDSAAQTARDSLRFSEITLELTKGLSDTYYSANPLTMADVMAVVNACKRSVARSNKAGPFRLQDVDWDAVAMDSKIASLPSALAQVRNINNKAIFEKEYTRLTGRTVRPPIRGW